MSSKAKPQSSDINPNVTKRYLSYGEIQERLYLSRTQLFRLEREGARLAPDVVVTPETRGWSPERVLKYGIQTGRLDKEGKPAGGWTEDGRPLNRVPDGSIAEMRRLVEDHYSAPPKVYLGSTHCSYLYGLTDLAVYFLRTRGAFIPANVKVGEKFLGWAEDEVILFGKQTGRLDDPETLRNWAVRRTQEFGMDPNTPWVVELLGADNLPKYEPLLHQAASGKAGSNTPD